VDIGKILKFFVLGFGALGLVAFFMPLIHVKVGEFHGKPSAWQVMKGLDKKENKELIKKAADAGGKLAAKAGANSKVLEGAKKIADNPGTAKWLLIIPFVPPALIALIGLFSIFTRYGRGGAAGTLLLGLIGVALFVVLYKIAGSDKPVGVKEVKDATGTGLMMLAASYVGATACGLVGLFKPEKEEFR